MERGSGRQNPHLHCHFCHAFLVPLSVTSSCDDEWVYIYLVPCCATFPPLFSPSHPTHPTPTTHALHAMPCAVLETPGWVVMGIPPQASFFPSLISDIIFHFIFHFVLAFGHLCLLCMGFKLRTGFNSSHCALHAQLFALNRAHTTTCHAFSLPHCPGVWYKTGRPDLLLYTSTSPLPLTYSCTHCPPLLPFLTYLLWAGSVIQSFTCTASPLLTSLPQWVGASCLPSLYYWEVVGGQALPGGREQGRAGRTGDRWEVSGGGGDVSAPPFPHPTFLSHFPTWEAHPSPTSHCWPAPSPASTTALQQRHLPRPLPPLLSG